jgi:sialate O-acetylesterase
MKMMKYRSILALANVVLFLTAVRGDVRLPGIIGDHMVLQQDRPILIWGWADPGETVAVTIGSDQGRTVAGTDGRWSVKLPARKAGGPLAVIVEGHNRLVINDVLIGEVWLCSGQSNMQFAMSSTSHAKEDIAAADYPKIRLFTVPKGCSLDPLADTRGAWKVCSPVTVGRFSAVAYFFGRDLFKELRSPVGLIASSWGGTNAEEWTSPDFLRDVPDLEPILRRWEESPAAVKALFRQPRTFDIWLDDFYLIPASGQDTPLLLDNFDDGDLHNALGGKWRLGGSQSDGRFNLEIAPSETNNTSAARLSGQLKVSDQFLLEVSLNAGGKAEDLGAYEGLSFKVKGAGFLRFHSLQPSITDWDNYSLPIFEASDEWRTVTIRFDELKQAGWGKRQAFTRNALSGFLFELAPLDAPFARPPSGLFNGMIAPVIPYTIRGAAWYQGEGNAGRSYQYRSLLPALIRSWRAAWGADPFPFLIVQLPNYRKWQPDPGESGWAELREAQFLTFRTVGNTGLVVTIDQGEADDVHPRNKREVGRRLARWALGATYDRPGAFSGPLFEGAVTEGGRIRVRFSHVGRGLVAFDGRPLRGFAIAGEDRVFHWAEAKLQGTEVVVWSDQVKAPVAVRYAWADNPDCNLYNRDGFPASPFRTDDWPGVTASQR